MIESFDSFEEMLAALAARQQNELEVVCGFQRELLDMEGNRYFMLLTDYGMFVFGKTWDWTSTQLRAMSEDDDELREEVQTYAESLKRGYVFTESYSHDYPEKELGSHHASRLYPINLTEFLRARDNQWLPDEALLLQFKLMRQLQIKEEMERRSMSKKPEQCPRCGKNTMPVADYDPGALSRLDNETYICSQCGVEEALEQFFFGRLTEEWAVPPKEATDE